VTNTAGTVLAPERTAVRSGWRRARRLWPLYVAISPFFILFTAFGLYPALYSLVLSFQKWNGLGDATWIGLGNYQALIADQTFWLSVRNTFFIFGISTIPMLLIALVVAAMLNANVRYSTTFRIAYFVPNITSVVAMAILFGAIFGESFGLANAALTSIGLSKVPWLTSPLGIQAVVAILITYQWTGYNAIIFLAGMQAISHDVYEAAKVDGAGPLRTFWSITVPLLRPTIIFVLIVSIITGLQTFAEPQVLTSAGSTTGPNMGGASHGGLTMALYFYAQAFGYNRFGYGASIAWGMFLIVLVFTLISWRYSRRREDPTR
jgi:cellobiose transport system permease protein